MARLYNVRVFLAQRPVLRQGRGSLGSQTAPSASSALHAAQGAAAGVGRGSVLRHAGVVSEERVSRSSAVIVSQRAAGKVQAAGERAGEAVVRTLAATALVGADARGG
ncbi:MAG: hypothetical protein PUF10_08775 [Bacteroidales bacterium]|nr:hypothetical protein [Bacteroidales bacterium]